MNDDYNIIDGVRPEEVQRRSNSKYPFGRMEPMQAFVVTESEIKRVRSAASIYAKRNGGRFVVRSRQDKTGKKQFICLRIE